MSDIEFTFNSKYLLHGNMFQLKPKPINDIYFLLQVFIALMLFFGHLRTTMNHNEFITTLAGIGILGGIHMFSWLVVFQFRRNLVEEMRIMARLVASAPPPPSGKYFQIFFSLVTKNQ